MKKIVAGVLASCLCGVAVAQTFTAETSLVFEPTQEQKEAFFTKNPPPALVVYQKKWKTLVLLAASHGPQSLPAVNYAFHEYHPQVALIEREPGQEFGPCTQMEDSYTAALSAKNNIPLVWADADIERQWKYAQKNGFSYEDFQMLWIIRSAYAFEEETGKKTNAAQEISDYARTIHNPSWGKLFTEDRLIAYFQEHYNRDFNSTDFVAFYQDLMNVRPKKWVTKTPFYKILYFDPDARSVFMLENIAAALNEYDVVFSEMGAGHFIDIHKSLKKMLGNPQFIQGEQIPKQEIWKDCTTENVQKKILVP